MALRFDARTSQIITDASSVTFVDPVVTTASTTTAAGLNVPEAVAAPSSPNDGDVWVTAAGEFFVRLNGVSTDLASGGVNATGSPANNYLAHWTDGTTITGDANLTWDNTNLNVVGGITVGSATTRPALLNSTTSVTVPTVTPYRADSNTGLGGDGADSLAAIAGGLTGQRWDEANAGVQIAYSISTGVTAFATGGQGGATRLIDSYNIVTTVATTGDSVRLHENFFVGTLVYVKNEGANSLDCFPASGDNLGAGTDTAVAIPAGEWKAFIGTTQQSVWTEFLPAAGGGTPTVITVADESTDTTCFPAFFTAATGDLGPKTSTGLTFNSNTHALGLTGPNTASTDVAHTISARGSAILNLIANTSDDDPGNNTAIIFSQDAGVDLANIGQSGEDDFGAEGEALNGAAIRDLVLHNREPTGISFGVNGQVGMRLNDSDNLAITGIASATTFSGSGASLTAIPVTGLADGTDGELITWSAAGVATTVAVGSTDEVLTSNGAGAAPTFQALPAVTQIVTEYVDAGSLTLSNTSYVTGLQVTLLEDVNYFITAVFDVQAPSADDVKIRFSGIGTSSSMNGVFHETETGGFEPIWATTAQSVSNEIVIPCNGGSNGQGLGTYCVITATVNVSGGDLTFIMQAAKNADTGADGFIRVYRGMTCIPIA